jgi:hypothetical protein
MRLGGMAVAVALLWCATSARGNGGSLPPASAPPANSSAKVSGPDIPSRVNLIAFIGRRVAVQPVAPKPGESAFNEEYTATFEVLQVIYGSYPEKEIRFSSFVHTGEPGFLKHEVGLVYVSQRNGRFVQQKYLYQRLYATKDGRWAGCGDPYEGMADEHRHGVKPVPIAFDPPVRIHMRERSAWEPRRRFPAPLFRRMGNVAICRMGNYPDDLFRVMADGILKARGVFGRNPN